MDIQHSLEDHSVPIETRKSIDYPDNAYLILTLNPDKTYQVVLFDGKNRKGYTHPESHWEIEQAKDEEPYLVLYNPPNYMPGDEFSSKAIGLVIIALEGPKGSVAFWNGDMDAIDFFYRVK
jgi:hypothetical protein